MKKARSMIWFFSFVLLLGLNSIALAQRDAGSLLDTILNEATRQGGRLPEDSPYYGSNPRDPDDYYSDRYYDARQGRRLTCESRGSQYNYCRTNVRGRIRLERQLSDTPCRKYDTWGADGDGSGVWVSNGCRAEFVVEPRRPDRSYGEGRGGGRRGRTIVCKSENYRSNYCRTGVRGEVSLARQLSEASCREYDTWGSDRDGGGIWVDKGCGGEFSIR